MESLWE